MQWQLSDLSGQLKSPAPRKDLAGHARIGIRNMRRVMWFTLQVSNLALEDQNLAPYQLGQG